MQKYCYILAVCLISMASKCKEVNCEITTDCFPDREIVNTLVLQDGEIQEVLPDLFAIIPSDGNGRFEACNLEKKYYVQGLKVKFCGVEKATLPHERRAASPFVLGHIENK